MAQSKPLTSCLKPVLRAKPYCGGHGQCNLFSCIKSVLSCLKINVNAVGFIEVFFFFLFF